jgi:hypothetical protein
MNPSQDQVQSALRTLIVALGSALAGWAIAKGWITKEQASAVLSNQEVIGAATAVILAGLGSAASAASGVWGLVVHKQVNMVAAVAAMPEVAKVEMKPTEAGVGIASAIANAPGVVVTVAPATPPHLPLGAGPPGG